MKHKKPPVQTVAAKCRSAASGGIGSNPFDNQRYSTRFTISAGSQSSQIRARPSMISPMLRLMRWQ